MKFYFIRHTSVDVPKGVIYGQTDVPLRDTFEEEASIVSSKIQHIDFDEVFVSPLTRCVRLADFCGFGNAVRDHRIMELNMGDWEMRRLKTATSLYEIQKRVDLLTVQPPNGESFRMLYDRVSNFIDEVRQLKHDVVGVFAHGGVLASAQIYNGQIQPQEIFNGSIIPYGAIVQIEV